MGTFHDEDLCSTEIVSNYPNTVAEQTTDSISAKGERRRAASAKLGQLYHLTTRPTTGTCITMTHPSQVLFFLVCTFLQFTSQTNDIVCSTALAAPPSPPKL